jgi:hypothetical protein
VIIKRYEDKVHLDMRLGEGLERLVGTDPKEMLRLSERLPHPSSRAGPQRPRCQASWRS